MKTTLLHNATIITAEKEAVGTIYIKEGKIASIIYKEEEDYPVKVFASCCEKGSPHKVISLTFCSCLTKS